MIPVITFVGYHNAGKTHLASQVVSELVERGYRVGVLKSSSKRALTFDTPGTDTAKYREAGATAVSLVAPDQQVIFRESTALHPATLAYRFFPDHDIVICEGFKHTASLPKIEVTRAGVPPLDRQQVTGIIAQVSDEQVESADRTFTLTETQLLTDFLVARFLQPSKKKDPGVAALLVNDKKIPINGFVQELLAGTLAGFVEMLKVKGEEEIEELEVRVRLKKR